MESRMQGNLHVRFGAGMKKPAPATLFFETFDVDAAARCGKGSVFGGVGRESTCS